MTVLFNLRCVLELAEHAVAAPSHRYHPDPDAVHGVAALTLAVSDTVYLLSAGVPSLDTASGVPRSVHAESGAVDLSAWRTDPDQVVDPNEFASARVRGGRQLPLVALRYLPLHHRAENSVIDLLRTAARAGHTHVTVDPADLSVGVVRRRHRTRTPAGR